MRVRVCAAVVGILLSGCKGKDRRVADAAIHAPAPAMNPPVEHVLASAHDAVRKGRTVDVDRRFTRALADVAKLTAQAPCSATRHGTHTTIACGGKHADVEELADFEALHDALALAVQDVVLPPGALPPPSNDWLLDGVAAGLARARSAGRRWSTERTAANALDGLHGLISTLLAEHDDFGLNDTVASRALALLVLAERGGPRPLEASLLAHSLGYGAASARLASTLPPTDVVRNYLTRPLAASTETEKDDHAGPLALELANLMLLEAGEADRAAAVRARMSEELAAQTAVQTARLLAPRHGEAVVLGPLAPWLSLADARELRGQPVARGTHLEDEAGMKALGATDRTQVMRQLAVTVAEIDRSSPFVDGGLIADHFRSIIASADDVYRTEASSASCGSCKTLRIESDVLDGEQKLDMPELEESASGLESSKRPADYDASLEWMRFDNLLVHGKISHSAMPEYLRRPHSLFGTPLEGALQAYWSHLGWSAPVQDEVEVEVVRHADGRPATRPLLASLAWHFYDLARYYELGRSYRDVIGDRASRLSDLMTIGDGHVDRVHARLLDAHAPLAERRIAFEALDEADRVDAADRKTMATLLSRPGASASDGARAAALVEKTDPRGAEALCTRWLRAHPDAVGTQTAAIVMTELAGLQRARKDYAAAERSIGPALAHGGDAAVHEAALIHLARKDVAGAEALALSNMRTRPMPATIGIAAETLLRGKHYAAAAQLLVSPPVPLDRQAMGWYVGRAIATAFPDEASLDAFVAELKKAEFNLSALGDWGYVFEMNGRHDLAFAVISMTPAEGFALVDNVAAAYPNLVAARGAVAANKWLRERLPASLLIPFAANVIPNGEVDVLFTAVPDPAGSDLPSDLLWWSRLVVLELHQEESGPRWERVRAHYAKSTGLTHYDVCARYALGLVPFAVVDKAIDDAAQLPEAGLILGARALAQGHVADAMDWFQVTVHTRKAEAPAYRLVHELLVKIAKSRLGPELMTEKWRAHAP